MKCCVGHNGYGACEKCTVVGEYIDDHPNKHMMVYYTFKSSIYGRSKCDRFNVYQLRIILVVMSD